MAPPLTCKNPLRQEDLAFQKLFCIAAASDVVARASADPQIVRESSKVVRTSISIWLYLKRRAPEVHPLVLHIVHRYLWKDLFPQELTQYATDLAGTPPFRERQQGALQQQHRHSSKRISCL